VESASKILPQLLSLSEEITDGPVKKLFQRFFADLTGVHDDIRLGTTAVEVRAYYQDILLCRAVPYRELFHMQIGESPTWEIRVRNETGFFEAFDRVLVRFLSIHATALDS
jgi:hypothetical protein